MSEHDKGWFLSSFETPVVNVWHVLSVSSVVHLFEAQTGKPVGNGKPIQHTVSGIMLQQNASPCKNNVLLCIGLYVTSKAMDCIN